MAGILFARSASSQSFAPAPFLPPNPRRFRARLTFGCKPQRMLPAVIQPEHRAHLSLQAIGRSGADRAACSAFLIWKMDFEAVCILVGHPRTGESLPCPGTKAGNIPCKHIHLRLAFHDPLRGQKTQAA